MEPQFVISFQDTEEMYCRLFTRLYSRRYMIYAIFFVLFSLWMGFLWLINWEWLYGVMMTIFVIGAVWYQNYPRSMGRKNYKQRTEHLNGKEPSIRMEFADEIRVIEDGSASSLSYSKVARMYFDAEMLIFVMEYHSAYFAPYSGLQEGTAEELIAFLQEKCANAKFYGLEKSPGKPQPESDKKGAE